MTLRVTSSVALLVCAMGLTACGTPVQHKIMTGTVGHISEFKNNGGGVYFTLKGDPGTTFKCSTYQARSCATLMKDNWVKFELGVEGDAFIADDPEAVNNVLEVRDSQ